MSSNDVDLEKKITHETTGRLIISEEIYSSLIYDWPHIVSATQSVSSSEPSLLKPRPFEVKPDRDALPEKTGTKVTRWLRCEHAILFLYDRTLKLTNISLKSTFSPRTAKYSRSSSPRIWRLLWDLLSRRRGRQKLQTLQMRPLPTSWPPSSSDKRTSLTCCTKLRSAFLTSLPLSIRRRLAKVFHYGGAHSGSGTSAVAWFILYVVLATKDYVDKPTIDNRNNLILSYVIITMFSLILASAYPRFRILFHDYFEAGHRYAGWITLITFWVHNGLVSLYNAREEGIPTGLYFAKSPNFWFFCVSTSCTLLSWSRLRRYDAFPGSSFRPCNPSALQVQGNAALLRPQNLDQALLEWHAFATIPDEDENGKINGFSVVVSNAGDWTRR